MNARTPELPAASDHAPATRHIAVVLHDAAPATWAACQRVLQAVEDVARVPVTLLAVPRYHFDAYDNHFEKSLSDRLAGGDELALHGYTHWDDGKPDGWVDYMRRRIYTAQEGEFCAMDASDASLRLCAGARWFDRNEWPLHGFVAPAWLMSSGTWDAVSRMPFKYTCTLREVYNLRKKETLRSHGLVYSARSAWRRALSRPVNQVVARSIADNALVRLELHPWDADFPAMRKSWQGLLARFMESRKAVTMVDALGP